MGNTFNSSGGEQNIRIGKGAIGKQVNTSATIPQVPVEDLLNLLPEKARALLRNEVAGAEI
jgi:hypothetical protein